MHTAVFFLFMIIHEWVSNMLSLESGTIIDQEFHLGSWKLGVEINMNMALIMRP